MHSPRAIAVLFTALVAVVHGHGTLVSVKGANGITGQGIGIIASTPRTGTTANPFQQDTNIIKDSEIAAGTVGVCGRTPKGGNNNVAADVTTLSDAGLPTIAADGTVSMTLHQVNGDGAGPYNCEISTDATGSKFEAMTIVTNVPGNNGNSGASATDFPLVAKTAAGTTCTGGPKGNACLVRCRNPAAAGPFGGCVVVTSAGSGSTSNTPANQKVAAGTTAATTTTTTTTTGASNEAKPSKDKAAGKPKPKPKKGKGKGKGKDKDKKTHDKAVGKDEKKTHDKAMGKDEKSKDKAVGKDEKKSEDKSEGKDKKTHDKAKGKEEKKDKDKAKTKDEKKSKDKSKSKDKKTHDKSKGKDEKKSMDKAKPKTAARDVEEESEKRSLIERFADYIGYSKPDYSRKRMFPSRIVNEEKRNQWI